MCLTADQQSSDRTGGRGRGDMTVINHNSGTALVIDADGHVCEPPDLWERNLPPSMRDRGVRVRWNDDLQTEQVLVEDGVGIPMGLAGLTNAGMHNNDNVANPMRSEGGNAAGVED